MAEIKCPKCGTTFKVDDSSYADILKEKFDVDVFNPDLDKIKSILNEHKVKYEEAAGAGRLLDYLWKIIRKESAGPYWLIHEPVELSPLAKKHAADPRVTERFHPVILGSELGNGYSELNDPLDQLARFEEQQAMRDAGDSEAQMLDKDFVEMLEYGMPPAGGIGWGIDRMIMLLSGEESIREVITFPMNKNAQDLMMDAPTTVSQKQLDDVHILINESHLN